MSDYNSGGPVAGPGGGIPIRVLFGEEEGDPYTTMRYDEDVICPRCKHVEPLIGWIRGKHQCFTGRQWKPGEEWA